MGSKFAGMTTAEVSAAIKNADQAAIDAQKFYEDIEAGRVQTHKSVIEQLELLETQANVVKAKIKEAVELNDELARRANVYCRQLQPNR